MEIEIIICILLLIVIIGLLIISMNKKNNRTEIEQVRRQVTQDLLSFQSNVSTMLRQDMNQLNETTSDRLYKMEHNVNEQLHKGFQTNGVVFQEVMQQVNKLSESQSHLQVLKDDITSLHLIFNDKKTRGIYGEIELYTLLESAYGEQFKKQYKLSNGSMVDAVIFGNEALGMIPIDSKFPLENYNRLQDPSMNRVQKQQIANDFKNDVKKHIQSISSKYIIANETSEFAYMFIPAEAIFSYINANLIEVVQYSYEKKVYLVSPTTLMAYITAIKALYLEQKKNEKMHEIQEELLKLSVEFERFNKRYQLVQKDYEKVYKEMNDVFISANKIQKRFEKIEAVELEEAKSIR